MKHHDCFISIGSLSCIFVKLRFINAENQEIESGAITFSEDWISQYSVIQVVCLYIPVDPNIVKTELIFIYCFFM